MSKIMRKRQPDLFATAQAERLPLVVEAKTVKLLSVLLKEAVAEAPVPSVQSGQEGRHDEDLR
jgi:hypothetical protein